MVDKRLKQCTDREVGDLMRFVQERFGLFEAEFAICHHAQTKAVAEKRKGAFGPMKRVVFYSRVSSIDQHTETQLCDLRPLAAARGYEIVGEYSDTISGTKAKRPGLDKLMSDARRGRFDIVMVWAFDRMARSVKHFLEVLDELTHLNIASLVSAKTSILPVPWVGP